MKIQFLLLCCLLLAFSCWQKSNPEQSSSLDYFLPEAHNRTAAEWEPALGALVVWPLGIPYTLAVELAKDSHLYTMVEDEATKAEAQEWFAKWGIDPSKVTFIFAPQDVDAWWTRDWGPSAVFTKNEGMQLGDGKYLYSTPQTDLACNDSLRFLFFTPEGEIMLTQIEDDATIPLAEQLGFGLLDLPFVNTGGNVITDGIGTAFSSCVLQRENEYFGNDLQHFLALNDSLLGFKDYHWLSNFENFGIQHIDCLMKLLDEETMLVAQPPADHELYEIYEDIVKNELSALKTAYGRPYRILRIGTDRYEREELAAYTNSLILNKTVYVPLFDIPQDSIALQTWSDALPGYTVKGFSFYLADELYQYEAMENHYRKYGWNDGDALHCRTRAIWDPEMLFISVKKAENVIESGQAATVYATIIDYSKKGLEPDQLHLKWRITGSDNWNINALNKTDNEHHFYATIAPQDTDKSIEYFIEAQSKSGTMDRKPRTAPEGFYTFNYN